MIIVTTTTTTTTTTITINTTNTAITTTTKYHLVPVLPRLIFQPSTRAAHANAHADVCHRKTLQFTAGSRHDTKTTLSRALLLRRINPFPISETNTVCATPDKVSNCFSRKQKGLYVVCMFPRI